MATPDFSESDFFFGIILAEEFLIDVRSGVYLFYLPAEENSLERKKGKIKYLQFYN